MQKAPTDNAPLSERELEILKQVATGAGNKQIAIQLSISPNTVRVHLRNIFTKINVASRTEAALYAVRTGLVRMTDAHPVEEPAAVEADDPTVNVAPAGLAASDLEPAFTADLGPPSALPETAIAPAPPPIVEKSVSNPPPTPAHRLRPWLIGLGATLIFMVVILGGWRLTQPSGRPTLAVTVAPSATPLPRWARAADMPEPRAAFAVAAYADQIYLLGGETLTGVTALARLYDPANDQWHDLPALPAAVADVEAAVIGGKIYIPGGRLASGALTSTVQVYDPLQQHWGTVAPLPMDLSQYALVAFEGHLLLFGGWDGTTYRAEVWDYDPQNDAWRARQPMPTARALAGAALAGGKIHVIGGTAGDLPLAAHEGYRPEQDRANGQPWETLPPLPVGRAGFGLASAADLIHVVGGLDDAGQTLPPLKYLPASNTWIPVEAPIWPLGARLGVVVVGANLYVFGGQANAPPQAQTSVFQAIYTTALPVIGQ